MPWGFMPSGFRYRHVFLFYSKGGNELRELPQQLVNIPTLTGKLEK